MKNRIIDCDYENVRSLPRNYFMSRTQPRWSTLNETKEKPKKEKKQKKTVHVEWKRCIFGCHD